MEHHRSDLYSLIGKLSGNCAMISEINVHYPGSLIPGNLFNARALHRARHGGACYIMVAMTTKLHEYHRAQQEPMIRPGLCHMTCCCNRVIRLFATIWHRENKLRPGDIYNKVVLSCCSQLR